MFVWYRPTVENTVLEYRTSSDNVRGLYKMGSVYLCTMLHGTKSGTLYVDEDKKLIQVVTIKALRKYLVGKDDTTTIYISPCYPKQVIEKYGEEEFEKYHIKVLNQRETRTTLLTYYDVFNTVVVGTWDDFSQVTHLSTQFSQYKEIKRLGVSAEELK